MLFTYQFHKDKKKNSLHHYGLLHVQFQIEIMIAVLLLKLKQDISNHKIFFILQGIFFLLNTLPAYSYH